MSFPAQISHFFTQHQIQLQAWPVQNELFLDETSGILIWLFDPQNKTHVNSLESIRNQAQLEGLRLIVLPIDFWVNKQELVQDRLLSLWKKSKRILAKNCVLDRVDKDTADAFLERNHFFGTCAAKHRLGLYSKNGHLQAIATFGKPRLMTYDEQYYSHEWLRYASSSNTTIIGGMGKLLQAFLLETKAVHVMTYADMNWGSGKSFEKLGFKKQAIKSNLGENLGASMKYILDLKAPSHDI